MLLIIKKKMLHNLLDLALILNSGKKTSREINNWLICFVHSFIHSICLASHNREVGNLHIVVINIQ